MATLAPPAPSKGGVTQRVLQEMGAEAAAEAQEASRRNEVDELCAFQRRAVAELEEEVAAVDAEIDAVEALVAEGNNRMYALRGLMQMRAHEARSRGGPAVPAVPPRTMERSHDYRGPIQQRRANPASDERASGPLTSPLAQEEDACVPMPVVGMVYSEFSKRYEAPRQSFQGPAGSAVVVLRNAGDPATQESLSGAAPGALVWLVYWLDRNAGFWREMVRPPRARGGWRVGLFATRSPHRPTPVGLSLVEVVRVEAGSAARMHVKGVDILDETPLVGWSLYNPATDSHPNLKSGWLDDTDKLQPLYYDEVHDGDGSAEEYRVTMDDCVREKLAFVDASTTIDVFGMLDRALSRMVRSESGELRTLDGRSERKPFPIARDGGSVSESGRGPLMYPVGAWRVWYAWDEDARVVRLVEVTSGIRKEVGLAEGGVDREVRQHREFTARFKQRHVW